MESIANYLQMHSRARAAILVVSFIVASVALCIGVGLCALTFEPKFGTDYVVRDRLIAGCLIALALLQNAGAALILSRHGGAFVPRLLFSALITVGGSVLVSVLVVARALIAQALFGHN